MRPMWMGRMFAAVLVIAATAAACTACADSDDGVTTQDEGEVADAGEFADEGDQPDESGSDVSAAGPSVLMMGRSVMGGWFEHWGWDWEAPVELDGFSLTYAELETPPHIASSACGYIEEAPEGSVVFFKFCFDDFWGGSGQEGEEELDDLEAWAEDVASCAADRGVTLIMGNALPKVAEYTDDALVEQHRSFNDWLDEFAAGSDGNVVVFDLYGPLTTSSGALRAEFAASPDDSHLSEGAYEMLDPLLVETLVDASE